MTPGAFLPKHTPLLILLALALGGCTFFFGELVSDGSFCNNSPTFPDGLWINIVQPIVDIIHTELGFDRTADPVELGAARRLYDIVVASSLRDAISAAIALYIVIYGILFMIGVIPLSIGDVIVRIMKVAIVTQVLLNWDFFYFHIGGIFIEGSDKLLEDVASVFVPKLMEPAVSGSLGGEPIEGAFAFLDIMLSTFLNPRLLVFISAAFFQGPYGWLVTIFAIFALIAFLGAIAEVLWIYLIALLAKALLFGLAPIFFAFMLFRQTQSIFMAWVNQLINFSLQPVFAFMYIAMLAAMLMALLEPMYGPKICWCRIEDFPFAEDFAFWRFMTENGQCPNFSFTGNLAGNCTGTNQLCYVPYDLASLIALFILAYCAWNVKEIITALTRDLSQSAIDFGSRGGLGSGIFAAPFYATVGMASGAVGRIR